MAGLTDHGLERKRSGRIILSGAHNKIGAVFLVMQTKDVDVCRPFATHSRRHVGAVIDGDCDSCQAIGRCTIPAIHLVVVTIAAIGFAGDR